jgi:hypothetical protein
MHGSGGGGRGLLATATWCLWLSQGLVLGLVCAWATWALAACAACGIWCSACCGRPRLGKCSASVPPPGPSPADGLHQAQVAVLLLCTLEA